MGEATTILMGTSEIEEILDDIDHRFNNFKNFDVVYHPPSDHHFISNPSIERSFFCKSRKSKSDDDRDVQLKNRIEQEWEILKHNLSNTILVRAYDGRVQLMRALIVGLEGTPYSHGLFFFDIYFPRDYPRKPPLIFQHCNHNLVSFNNESMVLSFKDGQVCEGLEGLETGSRFGWDPNTSNMYQVLEYIQRFVLRTPKIYAKDAEKDFLLSHIAMLGILRLPPWEFEDFVKGHFRKSSHVILMKFRTGGELGECEVRTELYFELMDAFEANGSYCKHLAYGVQRVNNKSNLSQYNKLYEISRSSSPKNNSVVTCLNSSHLRSIALCIAYAIIIGGVIFLIKLFLQKFS